MPGKIKGHLLAAILKGMETGGVITLPRCETVDHTWRRIEVEGPIHYGEESSENVRPLDSPEQA